MRQLAKTLWLGLAIALCASSSAWAQGEIRGLRTSSNPEFDRIVFDLGPIPVNARAVRGNEYVLEFEASPPALSFSEEDRLSALGVSVQRGGAGTRAVVNTRGRPVRVFRLGGGSGSSGRIVLDIGKPSTSSLPLPGDATPVPETQGASAPVLGGGSPTASNTGGSVPVLGGGSPAPAPSSSGGSGQVPVLGGGAPSTPPVALGGGNSAPPAAATGNEEVWVSVSAIDFEGVAGDAPSRDDLLNLELNVSIANNGDLVAPRTDLPVQTVTLRGLATEDRSRGRIGGSLLQQIVERIADEYEERGKYGTRIDISKRDLERLINERDGRLVIKISEASEAGSGAS